MVTETTPVAVCLTLAVRPERGLITPKKLSKNLPAEFACEVVLQNLHVNTFLQNSHVNTFPQNLQVNTRRFQNFLTTLTVRHTHIRAYQLRNHFYILYTTVLQAN